MIMILVMMWYFFDHRGGQEECHVMTNIVTIPFMENYSEHTENGLHILTTPVHQHFTTAMFGSVLLNLTLMAFDHAGPVMMTSSNGNIFRVTGPLWGEPLVTGGFHSQRPVTRSFDVFFDLHPNKRHRVHYDVTVMAYLMGLHFDPAISHSLSD